MRKGRSDVLMSMERGVGKRKCSKELVKSKPDGNSKKQFSKWKKFSMDMRIVEI